MYVSLLRIEADFKKYQADTAKLTGEHKDHHEKSLSKSEEARCRLKTDVWTGGGKLSAGVLRLKIQVQGA